MSYATKLRELAGKATPGRWRAGDDFYRRPAIFADNNRLAVMTSVSTGKNGENLPVNPVNDANFIAHLANGAPGLIGAIDALERIKAEAFGDNGSECREIATKALAELERVAA